MGNVNMEAYQVHFEGKTVAEKLKELDAVAQQIEDLPTFTTNDRVFLEAVPAMPTEDGEKFLKATTADGETTLSYDPITVPSGFTIKTKKYTGTGTTSIEHDFGDETPKLILAISIDPEFDNGNSDWATIIAFPWGCKMTAINWSVGSNNTPVPTGNGGGWRVGLAYAGNKITISGHDAGAACNRTGADYIIWYVV